MAVNERVVTVTDDKENYLQDAPAQATRAYYTPGKITPLINSATRDEQNWPKEFPVKVGLSVIDNAGGVDHVRIMLVGRGSICDVTVAAPISTGDVTVTVDDTAGGIHGVHIVHGTKTQQNNGVQERQSGYNGVEP